MTMTAPAAERHAYAARLQRWLVQAEAQEAALEAALERHERSRRARQALERMARADADRRGRSTALLSSPVPLPSAKRGRKKAGKRSPDTEDSSVGSSSSSVGSSASPAVESEDDQGVDSDEKEQSFQGDKRVKLAHSSQAVSALPPPPVAARAPPHTPPPPPPPPRQPMPPPHLPRAPPPPPTHPHALPQAQAAAALIAGLQFALDAERAAHRRLSNAYARLESTHVALRASHAELQERVYELHAKNVALWAMSDG